VRTCVMQISLERAAPLPVPPPLLLLPLILSRVFYHYHNNVELPRDTGRFLSKCYRQRHSGDRRFRYTADGSPIPRRESTVEPPTALISLARNVVTARRVPGHAPAEGGRVERGPSSVESRESGRTKLARYAIAVFARILIYISVCTNIPFLSFHLPARLRLRAAAISN